MISDIQTKIGYQNHPFIQGQWQAGHSTFDVLNPSTGEVIAQVSEANRESAESAVLAAASAFEKWKRQTAAERSKVLMNWFQLITEHAEEMAQLMTAEQGKPLKESRGEVKYGASFIQWFAEEAKRVYGDVIPSPSNDRRLMAIKQPVGVCAAITPWNFPLAMITRKIAPALAVGCTVVVKPAEDTPLTALALAELARQAGFPPGVINVLPCGSAEEVGEVITTHPAVSKISFTGSTQVGKLLMKNASDTVKKVSLELGGNAPFLVFDDADIEAAVKGAIASKYRNAGQTCVCANRILVQESVAEAFISAYQRAVSELVVGDGMEEQVDIGPLINEAAVEKVERLLQDALQKGGRIVSGGSRQPNSTFFEPTILAGANAQMDLSQEEIFGPVSPIFTFSTEEEGIQMANDTIYGLAAYFYARDMARIWRVSEGLQYGMVGVNTGLISTEVAPFGGTKQSGMGREGSKYGVDDYLEIKYIALAGM